jgi:hypothetical protein
MARMRVVVALSVGLGFLVSCTCVDASRVALFQCETGATCPSGWTCCADGLCRSRCESTGGGDAGGGTARRCPENDPCTGNAGAPCRAGVIACQDDRPICVDGPASLTGIACGGGFICRSGTCVTCTPQAPCNANPNPCFEGELQCGATSSCVDSTRPRLAGSPCGPGKVCTDTAACIACDEGRACSTNPSAPCVEGVIRCQSGAPVCVDGPPAPSGVACGENRVCLGGNCLPCIPGLSCTANPSAPCRRGTLQCGSSPSCADESLVLAGLVCGLNEVCNDQGRCLRCDSGAACDTNPNAACRRGVIDCASGAPVCVDGAAKPAGTACGAEQVCSPSGTCVACSAGGTCTTNPNPCRLGMLSCATGELSCVDGAPRPEGSCAQGQRCDGNGFCGPCVSGQSCSSNPGAPCRAGVVECTQEGSRCVDSLNVAAGTSCGADRVCNGMGSCVVCAAGAPCSTNPNPSCKTGSTSCVTGAPVCVDSGNRVAGTSCGPNQVCSPNGNCLLCFSNTPCTTNPNAACRNGLISCRSGLAECVDGSNKTAGTSCGNGDMCDALGNCGACVDNQPCNDNPGAPCRQGRTDCATGSRLCVDTMVAANPGTSCGTGQVCNSAGACVLCGAGNGCGSNPGLCKNGVTNCSTGSQTCVDSNNKPAGTVCGTNQVCSVSGVCTNCAAGSVCAPPNPCLNGSIACTSGSPVCVSGQRKGTGASCGQNLVCNAMDQCVSCTEGAMCGTNPNPTCREGRVECKTGAPVCVDGPAKSNGTPCMGGVCNAGQCTPCMSGASCDTNPNAACRNGVIGCSTGVAVCLDGTNKTNGTMCSGGVCSAGSCNPCVAGGGCGGNPNSCRQGVVSCNSGSAQCVDGMPVADMTPCMGGVCRGGFCDNCSPNAACSTNPNAACRFGAIDCGSMPAGCVDAANKQNGTGCPGGVCLNGACNACSEGATCTTNSNQACQEGVISCASGSPVCVNGMNKQNGTGCPGGVCLNGSCNPCSQSAACDPPNACKTGSTECASGSPVCVESGNRADGTSCPSGSCLGGNCIACVPGGSCTGNTNPCKVGVISCSTGSAQCVDGQDRPDLTACNGGRCVTGVCCTGCVATPMTTPACRAGNSKGACGIGGSACLACSGSNVCLDGACEPTCGTRICR